MNKKMLQTMSLALSLGVSVLTPLQASDPKGFSRDTEEERSVPLVPRRILKAKYKNRGETTETSIPPSQWVFARHSIVHPPPPPSIFRNLRETTSGATLIMSSEGDDLASPDDSSAVKHTGKPSDDSTMVMGAHVKSAVRKQKDDDIDGKYYFSVFRQTRDNSFFSTIRVKI